MAAARIAAKKAGTTRALTAWTVAHDEINTHVEGELNLPPEPQALIAYLTEEEVYCERAVERLTDLFSTASKRLQEYQTLAEGDAEELNRFVDYENRVDEAEERMDALKQRIKDRKGAIETQQRISRRIREFQERQGEDDEDDQEDDQQAAAPARQGQPQPQQNNGDLGLPAVPVNQPARIPDADGGGAAQPAADPPMNAVAPQELPQLPQAVAPAAGQLLAQLQVTAGFKLPELRLERFGGEPHLFKGFYSLFKAAIGDNNAIPNSVKMHYLLSLLSGPAKQLIQPIPIDDEGYQRAVDALVERYQNGTRVRSELLSKFNQVKQKDKDLSSARQSHELLSQLVEQLSNSGESVDCSIFKNMLLNKFHNNIVRRVVEKRAQNPVDISAMELLRMISKEIDHLQVKEELMMEVSPDTDSSKTEGKNRPKKDGEKNFQKNDKQRPEKFNSKPEQHSARPFQREDKGPEQKKNVPRKDNHPAKDRDKCFMCEGAHRAGNCTLSLMRKREFFTKEKRCFRCSNVGHTVAQCSRTCRYCKGEHHFLLCPQPQRSSTTTVNGHLVSGAVEHPMMTGRATIGHGTRTMEVDVLYDTGCNVSFIDKRTAADLKAVKIGKKKLTLRTFGNEPRGQDVDIVKVPIQTMDGPSEIICYATNRIGATSMSPHLPEEDRKELQKFGAQLSDPNMDSHRVSPQMLIGLDRIFNIVDFAEMSYLPSGYVRIPSAWGDIITGRADNFTQSVPTEVTSSMTLVENKPTRRRRKTPAARTVTRDEDAKTLHVTVSTKGRSTVSSDNSRHNAPPSSSRRQLPARENLQSRLDALMQQVEATSSSLGKIRASVKSLVRDYARRTPRTLERIPEEPCPEPGQRQADKPTPSMKQMENQLLQENGPVDFAKWSTNCMVTVVEEDTEPETEVSVNTANVEELANLDLQNAKDYWEIQMQGTRDPEAMMTKEEIQMESDKELRRHFKENLQMEDGFYMVKLPVEEERRHLLSKNYGLARKRLESQLKGKKEVLRAIDDLFKEYLERDMIEEVPFSEKVKGEGEVCYLPHHVVVKIKDNATKVRPVFDGSASEKSRISLNALLPAGPNSVEDMTGIIMRSRFYPILVVSDVEKAFLHVRIDHADRDLTRFLWISNVEDPNNSRLLHYRHKVLPFGLTCSPYLLNETIQTHLRKKRRNPFSNEILSSIASNLYVDNLAMGHNVPEEAKREIAEAIHFFEEFNMKLRMFASNRSDVLDGISPDLLDEEKTTISLLGIGWDKTRDEFIVKISVPPLDVVTRRNVASIVASVFDPMGWIEPVVLNMRIFLQDLWLNDKATWDTTFPEVAEIFRTLGEGIDGFALRIPRFYVTEDPCRFAVFVDASKKAYTACVYRVRLNRPAVLLMARTKLAPIKNRAMETAGHNARATTPKLELEALLLGMKLLHHVVARHNFSRDGSLSQDYLFTDSTICLAQLKKSDEDLNKDGIFVRNRIIKARTIGTEMINNDRQVYALHVATEENPADHGTRGLTPEQFHKSNWTSGPKFLEDPPDSWPNYSNREMIRVRENDLMVNTSEVTVYTAVSSVDEGLFSLQLKTPAHSTTPLSTRTTRWSSLLRVAALVLGFIDRVCKKPSIRAKVLSGIPQLGMMNGDNNSKRKAAVITVVKWSQSLQWPSQDSKELRSLKAFKDDLGVLRLKRRVNDPTLMDPCPPVIPGKGEIATLIAEHVHERTHAGENLLLARIRGEFWLTKPRALMKRIIKACVNCQKDQGHGYPYPQTPDLPAMRIDATRCYQNVGVDYAGSFIVRDERGERKVWVALFTCLVSRGVYLDFVPDCSTRSFCNAVIRFAARKGLPENWLCDNAPCFTLGSEVINSILLEEKSEEEIDRFLTDRGVTWRFLPAYSPWFGGAYERLICSMKQGLLKTFRKNIPTPEEFRTALCDVEAIINSRPLTYTATGDDWGVIRPIDFQTHGIQLSIPRVNLDELDGEYVVNEGRVLKTRLEALRAIRATQEYGLKFWKLFRELYLTALSEKSKVGQKIRGQERKLKTPKVGEIVMIRSQGPRMSWPMGKILELQDSKDGFTRSARILLPSHRETIRAINSLIPLEITDEIDVREPTATPQNVELTRYYNLKAHKDHPSDINLEEELADSPPGEDDNERHEVFVNLVNTQDAVCYFDQRHLRTIWELGEHTHSAVDVYKGDDLTARFAREDSQWNSENLAPPDSYTDSEYEDYSDEYYANIYFAIPVDDASWDADASDTDSILDQPSLDGDWQERVLNKLRDISPASPAEDEGWDEFLQLFPEHFWNEEPQATRPNSPAEAETTGQQELPPDEHAAPESSSGTDSSESDKDTSTSRVRCKSSSSDSDTPPARRRRGASAVSYLVFASLLGFVQSVNISIICSDAGVEVQSHGTEEMMVCSDGYCLTKQAPAQREMFNLPAAARVQEHSIALKYVANESVQTIQTKCPAVDFCANTCLWCWESIVNTDCHPLRTLAMVFLLAYILFVGVFVVCTSSFRIIDAIYLLARFWKWIKGKLRWRNRRNPRKTSFLLIPMIFCIIQGIQGCEQVNTWILRDNVCDNNKCVAYHLQQMELTPNDRVACMHLMKNDSTVAELRVTWKKMRLLCDHTTIAFTRSTTHKVISSKRCPRAGSCRDDFCERVTETTLIPELESLNSAPGKTRCQESCGGPGCGCLLPASGCVFSREALIPKTPDVLEVFNCPSWREIAEVEIQLTDRIRKTTERISVELEPGVIQTINGHELTLSHLHVPYNQWQSSHFVTNGKGSIAVVEDEPVRLWCETRQKAETLDCQADTECECHPTGNELNCKCKDNDVGTTLQKVEKTLPIFSPRATLLSKNNSVEIGIWATGSLTVKWNLTYDTGSHIVDRDHCTLTQLNPISGCYSCTKGSALDVTCLSKEKKTMATVDCGEDITSHLIPCSPQGVKSTLRFHTDNAEFDKKCVISCGNEASYTHIQGTLRYAISGTSSGAWSLTHPVNFSPENKLILPDFMNWISQLMKWRLIVLTSVLSLGLLLYATYLLAPALWFFLSARHSSRGSAKDKTH